MATSDRNTRRDEAERARHIAASEAAAFGTTAGTMLLGLLAGAEASHNRNDAPPPAATQPPVPSSHPTEAAPLEATPADHPEPAPLDDRHAGEIEAPTANPMPTIMADTAETTPHPTTLVDAPTDSQAVTAQTLISSIPVWTFSAPARQAPSPGESANVNETTPPVAIDAASPVHQLVETISGLLDTTLTTVTHTVASVTTAVGQLTSSLTGTVSDLVGGLTGLVTNLTHDAPATEAAEQPLAGILGPTPMPTEPSDTTHHGASLLDTAGAVPTALLNPLPLHLGFLGQPTADGHETHDGAFSALGVHHF